MGIVFLLGLFTQSAYVFLSLSLLLWWSALRPEQNPFEMLYNRTLGKRPGAEQLSSAPSPRRFAQGMAATLTLLIAVCLFFNRPLWAYILEFMMGLALLALVASGFCLGSVVYYLCRGQSDIVKRTLPWA